MLPFLLAVFSTTTPTIGPEPSGVEFRVRLEPTVRAEPAAGRLLVLLVKEGSKIGPRTEPADGPFFEDPQPLYGIDARLAPGETALVGDAADSFPVKLSELPAGKYRAQARFDLVQRDSAWRREDGNLYSKPVAFEVPGAGTIDLALDKVVRVEPPRAIEGVEWFEVRSELLSKFRGQDVVLRAGVVLPVGFDAQRKYAAVYEVPGFGGNHRSASGPRKRDKDDVSAKSVLARETFKIVLDPEGPNGHTLFADSENNGPCGAALVRELIPALEKKYPLIAEPSARLLRGHSSGGWSTLWLALTYPDVFGATWSSSPDPVDFRRFQRIDLYGDENFYVRAGAEIASYRSGGAVRMTTRQENGGENVVGPDNTSGQQWDSWFAVFGPRNEHGHPAALYDPATGRIDRKIAESYRRYDIGALLRAEPSRYAPIFRQNVRLLCGGEDSFYLNEAVELLTRDLAATPSAPGPGYVTIVPGLDHGTIYSSEEMRRAPDEMLAHLRAKGHVAAAK
ncbi:MAG: alpha/beta hydrolase-fold protein [Planctomycetota bacterium]|nr:alpha/beta hydrolase-fold protein [Planctomycetota bacterium]